MKGFDELREKWEATIENGNLQSLLDEKLSQFQVIVYLPVKNQFVSVVIGNHGLLTMLQINDGKSTMT